MAMTAGSVVVAKVLIDPGPPAIYEIQETKSGLAEAYYDARKADYLAVYALVAAQIAATGQPVPAAPDMDSELAALQAIARASNTDAEVLVGYVSAHAEAVIPTGAGGAGLQRTPNPNNPDTATQAPAAEKTLAIR